MPRHLFDQTVRHGEPRIGPPAALAGESPRDSACQRQPGKEQRHQQPAARAHRQKGAGQCQLNHGYGCGESTRKRQGFHGLGFRNAAEEAARAFLRDCAGAQTQRSRQQPLFQ